MAAPTQSTRQPRKRVADVPRLGVPRLAAGERLIIDGSMNEAAWARAGLASVATHAQTGRVVPAGAVRGEVRLLWDGDAMYLFFAVEDRDVTGGFPADAVDAHLWTRDTIEAMVDPDGDGDNRDYYEVQVNPQNLVFDSLFDNYNEPRGGESGPFGHQEWSARLESATVIEGTLDESSPDRGYRVELRIPWASFTRAKRSPPAIGDTWRMNFYVMENNGGSSWSPILGQGNFHRASRFGRVVWSP